MRRVLVLLMLSCVPAMAQAVAPPDLATLEQRTARRFPQPVRVGDLIGRAVLAPSESQTVLGRVASVVKSRDGHLRMVMRYGGVFGIGPRRIAVPIEAMALLGDVVVAVDYTDAQLAALPDATDQAGALGPDATIRMGLVKPYH